MACWVQVLTANPADLSLSCGTHKMEEENRVPQMISNTLSLSLPLYVKQKRDRR